MAKPKVDIKVLDNRTMLMDGVLHILVPISDISCDGCMLRVDGGYICRNYSNELPTCISEKIGNMIWVLEASVQKEIVPAQC